jgi:3-mercaptopyruvate sulfurtransferase SseA
MMVFITGRLLMRAILLSLLMILTGVGVFVGCNSSDGKGTAAAQKEEKKGGQQVQTVYADGARRITIVEAQELIKKGQAFVVDVRNQESYDVGHIPGAKLIPSGEILNHLDELPKDKTIITYCS